MLVKYTVMNIIVCMYMFKMEGYILELKCNIYGLGDILIKFHEHSKGGLAKHSFESSQFDPCLFKSEHLMILTYINVHLFSHEEEHIDLTQRGETSLRWI